MQEIHKPVIFRLFKVSIVDIFGWQLAKNVFLKQKQSFCENQGVLTNHTYKCQLLQRYFSRISFTNNLVFPKISCFCEHVCNQKPYIRQIELKLQLTKKQPIHLINKKLDKFIFTFLNFTSSFFRQKIYNVQQWLSKETNLLSLIKQFKSHRD